MLPSLRESIAEQFDLDAAYGREFGRREFLMPPRSGALRGETLRFAERWDRGPGSDFSRWRYGVGQLELFPTPDVPTN